MKRSVNERKVRNQGRLLQRFDFFFVVEIKSWSWRSDWRWNRYIGGKLEWDADPWALETFELGISRDGLRLNVVHGHLTDLILRQRRPFVLFWPGVVFCLFDIRHLWILDDDLFFFFLLLPLHDCRTVAFRLAILLVAFYLFFALFLVLLLFIPRKFLPHRRDLLRQLFKLNFCIFSQHSGHLLKEAVVAAHWLLNWLGCDLLWLRTCLRSQHTLQILLWSWAVRSLLWLISLKSHPLL